MDQPRPHFPARPRFLAVPVSPPVASGTVGPLVNVATVTPAAALTPNESDALPLNG